MKNAVFSHIVSLRLRVKSEFVPLFNLHYPSSFRRCLSEESLRTLAQFPSVSLSCWSFSIKHSGSSFCQTLVIRFTDVARFLDEYQRRVPLLVPARHSQLFLCCPYAPTVAHAASPKRADHRPRVADTQRSSDTPRALSYRECLISRAVTCGARLLEEVASFLSTRCGKSEFCSRFRFQPCPASRSRE